MAAKELKKRRKEALQNKDLHKADDSQTIKQLLDAGADPNKRNENGDCSIHTIVRRPVTDKNKFPLLISLLIHSDVTTFCIDARTDDDSGYTALHLAVQAKDWKCTKALLVFGAHVNELNLKGENAVDIAKELNQAEMVEFLMTHGGVEGNSLKYSFGKGMNDIMPVAAEQTDSYVPEAKSISVAAGNVGATNQGTAAKPSKGLKVNTSKSCQPEMHTGETPLAFHVRGGGERILCLDGGGLKGLILIEVLQMIQQLSGKEIVDLFSWIVGTSTGGIVALALVYAKATLEQIKQLFFQLKEEVFTTGSRQGYGYDSSKMEAILRSFFGEDMKLSDKSEPRVMITAVDCKDTDLKLRFFNNCFHDDFSDKLVWQVARYTSAAPVYFEPLDHYIDGGIKANNPTDFALTKIQEFLDQQHREIAMFASRKSQDPDNSLQDNKPPVSVGPSYSCVVSVGCGVYPPEEISDFNVQKYLVFGKHSVQVGKMFSEFENLLKLLAGALSNEEEVAANCKSRCTKQGIPFYRFNPVIEDKVKTGETDTEKLCELVLKAQAHIAAWEYQIDELVQVIRRSTMMGPDGKPQFI